MEKKEIRNNKLQLLGKLFTDLMHEIRNPITVLKINMDLLEQESDKENEEIGEILSSGKEAISVMEKLIAQTMEFIRGNEGELERCSLNEIVETACNFTRQQANKNGIKINKNLTEENPQIIANKSQIVQVILNLLSNSFDAVEKNPLINLKTYSRDGEIFLEVEDNGKGIGKDLQNKIFNKYFTTKTNGAGIGLAVSKEILERHNAEIYLESEPGKGTKFTIKFKNAKEENL